MRLDDSDAALDFLAGESVLKHIPLSTLKDLGLTPLMNFPEEVLLIRGEYDTALDTFQIGVKQGEGALSSQVNPALVRATWMRHDTELTNSIMSSSSTSCSTA